MTDWSAWHDDYDDPASNHSRRLAFVQAHIRDVLDSTSGPITITSACAGDGRGVLDVLARRADAERARVTLIEALPSMCRTGTVVLWTRTRAAPDLTGQIRSWFSEAGFAEESFTAPGGVLFSVGRHRYRGEPQPLRPGQQVFTFVR